MCSPLRMIDDTTYTLPLFKNSQTHPFDFMKNISQSTHFQKPDFGIFISFFEVTEKIKIEIIKSQVFK